MLVERVLEVEDADLATPVRSGSQMRFGEW
jgi:hypothetical protein